MSSRVNSHPSNPVDATNPTARSSKQRSRALRNRTQEGVTPTLGVPLEQVPRCEDLWFEDGDVIIWVQDKNGSLLFRVHCHVLKESGAEPFCTVVNCEYPNPKTSDETFLNGVWVLKYADQDPVDIMYVLKWMYERP